MNGQRPSPAPRWLHEGVAGFSLVPVFLAGFFLIHVFALLPLNGLAHRLGVRGMPDFLFYPEMGFLFLGSIALAVFFRNRIRKSTGTVKNHVFALLALAGLLAVETGFLLSLLAFLA